MSEYRDFVKDDYVQSKQGNNEEVGIYENKAVARVIRICEPGPPQSSCPGVCAKNELNEKKETVLSGMERDRKMHMKIASHTRPNLGLGNETDNAGVNAPIPTRKV